MPKPLSEDIPSPVRMALLERNISASDLAELIDLSPACVQDSLKRTDGHVKLFARIAKALNIEPGTLIAICKEADRENQLNILFQQAGYQSSIELARHLDVSPTTIRKLYKGQVSRTVLNWVKVVEFLEVPFICAG